ncbi:MAG: ECF transporter S component [Clostridia bacterium]|nr:ECF transporter S component [Clostridia bacterium]
MKTANLEKTKKLVSLALFCAVSFIGMFFRFNVSFLSFDLKDAFLTIGAMFFGPLAGIFMSACVAFLEFITISDTGVYGLIMNFLSSAVFASVAPLIYKYRRKMSGAVLGLMASVVATVSVMLLANLLITPYYMGVGIDTVKTLIPTLLLPFNLTKTVLNSALVLLLYKPVTTALRKTKLLVSKKTDEASNKPSVMKTVVSVIVSVIIIALCLAVFFIVLKGSFSLT